MTTDLWMLVYSALLCLTIPLVASLGMGRLPGGTQWGLGNRDTPFAIPDWIGRTKRAHQNMVEAIGPFACLVLVAHVAGKADATTALGAQVFLAGRIAHAGLYIVGVPVVRTVAFFVAIAGDFMILSRIMA